MGEGEGLDLPGDLEGEGRLPDGDRFEGAVDPRLVLLPEWCRTGAVCIAEKRVAPCTLLYAVDHGYAPADEALEAFLAGVEVILGGE